MDFGRKVRVMRVVRGLTQIELARKAEISKPYLAIIETGQVTPTEGFAKRLRDALDWTPEIEQAFVILEGQNESVTPC